ncbi:lysozyme family protein [Sphingomonas immobilis]|uniref:Glycoside hydrolase family protein n=1 Tax=Sphingomonas immobilis TaxID=3063997 RepID=A0ABT8ZYY4_9SPHN|nr:glycoside hydrolase family protein [Sphingomonas sp. CA1-15]MDO7842784.1 glycoside hydrolase family protein [Sphingomonas sp. CA1-15]
MAECDINTPNVKAFLKLIRYAEHYPDASDNFYYTLYGGGTFKGDAAHPNTAVSKWGHTSTAAGAYQILYGTWKEAFDKKIVTDFKPASQDKLAFAKLKSRGALGSVCNGDLTTAYALLKNEWTSLPGAKQSRLAASVAEKYFADAGGKVAEKAQ